MKGTQSLFDALGASGFDSNGRDIRRAPAPVEFQSAIAAELLASRQAALGMSPVMVEQAIERGMAAVYAAVDRCESPIEKRLLPWLVFADYGDRLLTIPAEVHWPRSEAVLPNGDVVIVPQFAFAKYRMDFAIVTRLGAITRITCVECDGAEAHGSAAMAESDAIRDGYLASWGIPTVRFSGKEIFASPLHCITRVATAVQSQWEPA